MLSAIFLEIMRFRRSNQKVKKALNCDRWGLVFKVCKGFVVVLRGGCDWFEGSKLIICVLDKEYL